jgi:hypothetical protein
LSVLSLAHHDGRQHVAEGPRAIVAEGLIHAPDDHCFRDEKFEAGNDGRNGFAARDGWDAMATLLLEAIG